MVVITSYTELRPWAAGREVGVRGVGAHRVGSVRAEEVEAERGAPAGVVTEREVTVG